MMKNNGETDSEDNDATFSFFFFYTQLKKLKEVNFWDTSNLR